MGSCTWEWLGLSWDKISDTCTGGTHCNPPGFSGTYIGQTVGTTCGDD